MLFTSPQNHDGKDFHFYLAEGKYFSEDRFSQTIYYDIFPTQMYWEIANTLRFISMPLCSFYFDGYQVVVSWVRCKIQLDWLCPHVKAPTRQSGVGQQRRTRKIIATG